MKLHTSSILKAEDEIQRHPVSYVRSVVSRPDDSRPAAQRTSDGSIRSLHPRSERPGDHRQRETGRPRRGSRGDSTRGSVGLNELGRAGGEARGAPRARGRAHLGRHDVVFGILRRLDVHAGRVMRGRRSVLLSLGEQVVVVFFWDTSTLLGARELALAREVALGVLELFGGVDGLVRGVRRVGAARARHGL